MSDFGDRIRDARGSAKQAELVLIHPPVVEEQDAEPPADPAEDPLLERQRRRVEELSRKVEALKARFLQEIVRQPRGVEAYPRTLAVLADELVERAEDGDVDNQTEEPPSS